MAERRVLPAFLSDVSSRYKTPVPASLVVGVFVVAITWVYLMVTSVQNALTDVVDATGLLFSALYILAGLATVAYYRRRIMARPADLIWLGVLPLAASAFLGLDHREVDAAGGRARELVDPRGSWWWA